MIKKIPLSLLFIFIFALTACSIVTENKSPTSAAAYNTQLGMGYLQQGDMQRAKSKLLTAIAQAPDSAPAHDAMAYFLENTGDTRNAEKYYLRAISLQPKSGETHNNYGAFLCRMKRFQQADQQFMLAVQDPNYLNMAGAYENAGICAMQIPDANKATAYLQKASLQDPRRPLPYLELGQLSYQQGNYQVAQQFFDRYAALIGNDMEPEGLWLGIRLARKLGDSETAGNYTLTLQSKFPNSPEYKALINSKTNP